MYSAEAVWHLISSSSDLSERTTAFRDLFTAIVSGECASAPMPTQWDEDGMPDQYKYPTYVESASESSSSDEQDEEDDDNDDDDDDDDEDHEQASSDHHGSESSEEPGPFRRGRGRRTPTSRRGRGGAFAASATPRVKDEKKPSVADEPVATEARVIQSGLSEVSKAAATTTTVKEEEEMALEEYGDVDDDAELLLSPHKRVGSKRRRKVLGSKSTRGGKRQRTAAGSNNVGEVDEHSSEPEPANESKPVKRALASSSSSTSELSKSASGGKSSARATPEPEEDLYSSEMADLQRQEDEAVNDEDFDDSDEMALDSELNLRYRTWRYSDFLSAALVILDRTTERYLSYMQPTEHMAVVDGATSTSAAPLNSGTFAASSAAAEPSHASTGQRATAPEFEHLEMLAGLHFAESDSAGKPASTNSKVAASSLPSDNAASSAESVPREQAEAYLEQCWNSDSPLDHAALSHIAQQLGWSIQHVSEWFTQRRDRATMLSSVGTAEPSHDSSTLHSSTGSDATNDVASSLSLLTDMALASLESDAYSMLLSLPSSAASAEVAPAPEEPPTPIGKFGRTVAAVDGRIAVLDKLLSDEEAYIVMRAVNMHLKGKWKQPTVLLYGKAWPEPCVQVYFGELSYQSATGVKYRRAPFSRLMTAVRHLLQAVTGRSFNSIMVTKYRDRHESEQEWAKSDEKCLGEPEEQLLATLALGNTREVQLRRVAMEWVREPGPRRRSRSVLEDEAPPTLQQVVKSATEVHSSSGDLLFFASPALKHWQHRVLEGPEAEHGIRIALTARNVVTDALGRRQSSGPGAVASASSASSAIGSLAKVGSTGRTSQPTTPKKPARTPSTSSLRAKDERQEQDLDDGAAAAAAAAAVGASMMTMADDDRDDGVAPGRSSSAPRFGEIPGCPPGTVVSSAGELLTTGLHRQPRKSISTNRGLVESLKLSANPYRTVIEPDGKTIIYTVEMRERDAEQGTIGVEMMANYKQKIAVRVVQKVPTPRALPSSYRYLGLYDVAKFDTERNPATGSITYHFFLYQAPIAGV